MQEKLVANNYYLNKSAKDAYRSYLLAYNSHSMKDIFNVHRLDLQVPSFKATMFTSILTSKHLCKFNSGVFLSEEV